MDEFEGMRIPAQDIIGEDTSLPLTTETRSPNTNILERPQENPKTNKLRIYPELLEAMLWDDEPTLEELKQLTRDEFMTVTT